MFFFISISFISIPETRFEKKKKHIVQIDKHIAEAQIEKNLDKIRHCAAGAKFYEISNKISIWIRIF